MDMFVVRGGRPLSGRVQISGAKNAALPIMAASLMCHGRTTLQSVPNLVDVATLIELLRSLGMRVERDSQDLLQLETIDESCSIADYELVRRMRASFCVLGPLLAKRGKACVSLPGGCNIGDRPIDLHLKGLRALGANIDVARGYVIAEAKQLRGADIFLGGAFGSTVTGTCNVMMAATLADGVTNIEAASCEPEVVDLGTFLNAAGARISGLGTPFLRIEGVEELRGPDHTVIPDRIEAATMMIAAAISGGSIEIENVRLNQMTAILEKFREMGLSMTVIRRDEQNSENATVSVSASSLLKAVDCTALPYPGVPTDVQAQLMAALTQAPGISVITDRVFPDRFMHAAELVRMGAHIRREGPTAVIHGGNRLSGACVMASDLRASAALVLAGLAAEGETVIRRIYHLDRGYERLEVKLNRLGADIRRVDDVPENMPSSLAVSQQTPPAQESEPLLKGPSWGSRKGTSGTTIDGTVAEHEST